MFVCPIVMVSVFFQSGRGTGTMGTKMPEKMLAHGQKIHGPGQMAVVSKNPFQV